MDERLTHVFWSDDGLEVTGGVWSWRWDCVILGGWLDALSKSRLQAGYSPRIRGRDLVEALGTSPTVARTVCVQAPDGVPVTAAFYSGPEDRVVRANAYQPQHSQRVDFSVYAQDGLPGSEAARALLRAESERYGSATITPVWAVRHRLEIDYLLLSPVEQEPLEEHPARARIYALLERRGIGNDPVGTALRFNADQLLELESLLRKYLT